jgi:hypothetical protein
MTYTHRPNTGALMTPAQRAQHVQKVAREIEAANAVLRHALQESEQLAEAITRAEAQVKYLREVVREQNRLTDYSRRVTAANLALKYANTQYGGRAGLEAAAAEMAEHDARKRSQKVTA